MAEVTVKQLADVVGVSVERLLNQMQDAGIKGKSETSMVSETERQSLLTHLKKSHGDEGAVAEPSRITLKRKTTSQLKVAGAAGKRKTVNVEVRKKRTYVKREGLDEASNSPEIEVAANEAIAQPDVVAETGVSAEPVVSNVEAVAEVKAAEAADASVADKVEAAPVAQKVAATSTVSDIAVVTEPVEEKKGPARTKTKENRPKGGGRRDEDDSPRRGKPAATRKALA